MPHRSPILRGLSLLVAGGLLLCFLACQKGVRFYSYQPVDPHGWSCLDTLRFELPADTIASLNTYSLGARFSQRVEYSGLWLVLEQRANPTEGLVETPPPPRRDTLFLPLIHENGKLKGNDAVIHETEAVCTAAQTTPNTPLTLLVYHIMPMQEVSGVLEIGLKVE